VRTPGSAYSRFTFGAVDAYDATGDSTETAAVDVGELAARILIEGQPLADFACIPLARIIERTNAKVMLDDDFIPTVLRSGAAPPLARFLKELQGLLVRRGDECAQYASGVGRSAAAQVSDYLLLQVCNRYQPMVAHWCAAADVHPEDFYVAALALAGELATYLSETRRPGSYPAYDHTRLQTSFEPVIRELQRALGRPRMRAAEEIALTILSDIGMWHGVISDRTLIDSASFVLAVRADVPDEEIRRRFPGQAKMASVKEIRRYIVEMVPALGLKARAQAPPQIPYHADAVYFDVDTRGAAWNAVRTEGQIAIHVGGQFPGIALALWAIRG
jgi:type VI secretion system protein ImpJ